MAKSNAVWGIDIGQCALKALRCLPHEKDANRIVADAFDYIEYPKILSQPEADREELIREALEQFVSHNDVKDDRVAISVPGQSGLARFIKLPPVEAKKIPDIVKYEARQQIPFALEDVVWDYQPLAGGSEDDGYALETEVGLFAMKRDQVGRALEPFEVAGIDVDFVQLAPLSIYNFITFDRLGNLANVEGYNPEDPPPSTIVISLGTETTDLVITNGFRVWQRNIPIGGNHFTKALTKELRLTFSKAEHLKRNAMKAEDPKAVFLAMRPVFSDLVAEIQRSLGFFTSNNRQAKLGDVVVLGNPIKLPGLQRYLSQNLDQKVKPIEEFSALVGSTALSAPQFKENQLSFGVAYGLCVQGLGLAQLHTNLLPEEIVTTRLVRAKKPWAVAAAALLMTGMAVNYASHYSAWRSAAIDTNDAMKTALSNSQKWTSEASSLASTNQALRQKFEDVNTIGRNLQSNVDGRLLWLEVLNAIDASLPRDPRDVAEREETAEDVMTRPELHITSIDCQHFEDLSQWYTGIQRYYDESRQEFIMEEPPSEEEAAAAEAADPDAPAAPAAEQPAAEEPMDDPAAGDVAADEFAADDYAADEFADDQFADGEFAEDGASGGLSGPGWVIQLDGYHFHNIDPKDEGAQFVERTLIEHLEEGTVKLPDGPGGQLVDVPIADLGIMYPVVVTKNSIYKVTYFPGASSADEAKRLSRQAVPGTGGVEPRRSRRGSAEEEPEPVEPWELRRYDFIVQFAWVPTPRTDRLEKARESAGEGTVDALDTADASRDGLDNI